MPAFFIVSHRHLVIMGLEQEGIICCLVTAGVIVLIVIMGFSSLEYNEYGLDYSSWSKEVTFR